MLPHLRRRQKDPKAQKGAKMAVMIVVVSIVGFAVWYFLVNRPPKLWECVNTGKCEQTTQGVHDSYDKCMEDCERVV